MGLGYKFRVLLGCFGCGWLLAFGFDGFGLDFVISVGAGLLGGWLWSSRFGCRFLDFGVRVLPGLWF